ncbi:MAG: ABC transporter permease [Magnetospiraceae bacterium]
MTFISLSYVDLAIAAFLVLANAGLSALFQLGIERQFLIAALRTVLQLSLMGWVLKTIFTLSSPYLTGAAALFMILFAGWEIMSRQQKKLVGWWSYGLGTTCMLFAATLVTVFALTTQVQPDPWYDPRYALPLLGMILGNTMNGISLGLQTLTRAVTQNRVAVEAQLCLGETRWVATLPFTKDALRTALTPIINAMAAAGLVSLPGMMTGQILAGADPQEAVKYQILIMFLIAGGTGIGALTAVMGGVIRLTDHRHRLRVDRLR